MMKHTPNTHITHFEDLIFSHDKTAGETLRDLLYFEDDKIGLTSIKYDGSTSIVFGSYQDSFIFGTKSFFNKKPIYLKVSEDSPPSEEEITKVLKYDSIINFYKNNIERLKTASCPFRDIPILFQGDIMSTSSLRGEANDYAPNVIMYKNVPIESLCVHTTYVSNIDGIVSRSDYNDILLDTTNINVFTPPTASVFHGAAGDRNKSFLYKDTIDFVLDVRSQIEELSRIDEIYSKAFAVETQIFVNWCIRNKRAIDAESYNFYMRDVRPAGSSERYLKHDTQIVWDMFEAINILIKFKSYVMDKNRAVFSKQSYPRQRTSTRPLKVVKGESHEGYVTSVNEGLVKFIDRRDFSHRNFSKWSKNK